jgi:serine/threonine protein kinase
MLSDSKIESFINQVIDEQFALRSLLAKSKSKVTFLAEELASGNSLEIIFSPYSPSSPELTQKYQKLFLQIAQNIHSIVHPNLLDLQNYGFYQGFAYVVYRYKIEKTIGEVLEERDKLSLENTISIIGKISEVLEVALQQGVIHGDLSPEKIIFRENSEEAISPLVKYLALSELLECYKIIEEQEYLEIPGDPEYIPPEKIQGNQTTSESDVYSLGILTYRMLTGATPFPLRSKTSESIMDVLAAHVSEEAEPITSILTSLPRELDAIIAHALAKSPQDRPSNATEFSKQLEKIKLGTESLFSFSNKQEQLEATEIEGVINNLPPLFPSYSELPHVSEKHFDLFAEKSPSLSSQMFPSYSELPKTFEEKPQIESRSKLPIQDKFTSSAKQRAIRDNDSLKNSKSGNKAIADYKLSRPKKSLISIIAIMVVAILIMLGSLLFVLFKSNKTEQRQQTLEQKTTTRSENSASPIKAEFKFGVVSLEKILFASILGKTIQADYAEEFLQLQNDPNKEELLKDLKRRHLSKVSNLLSKIRILIKRYGEENQFSVITTENRTQEAIVYLNPEITNPDAIFEKTPETIDLTNPIIKLFNENVN